MKIAMMIVSLLLCLCGCNTPVEKATPNETIFERAAISALFDANQLEGTCVILDLQTQQMIGHNQARSLQRFSPASTFKIYNALIALSLGRLTSVDEIFYRHDGSKLFLPTWEHDMSLRLGMQVSHVPAFKQVASMIGAPAMQRELTRLAYGNMTAGNADDLTNFWLTGQLKISAQEQVRLLAKLATYRLPYPREAQAKIREICLLKRNATWALYGKTGWFNRELAWFVGWLESQGKIYCFALNCHLAQFDRLVIREQIIEQALRRLELIPPRPNQPRIDEAAALECGM